MSPSLRPTPLVAALGAALVLAACGGDSGAGSDAGGGGRRDAGGGGGEADVSGTDAPDIGGTDAEDVTRIDLGGLDTQADADGSGAEDTGAVCTPGTRLCFDLATAAECRADGSGYDTTACGDGFVCFGNPGACHAAACRPGERECTDTETYRECAADGSVWLGANSCGPGLYCDDGRCLDRTCLPNVLFAVDGSSSMVSEWPTIQTSIDAVVSANPDVAFGLAMFPTGLGCSIGDGTGGLFGSPGVSWPDVPIQANASRALTRWFTDHDPGAGATPLISTIEWLSENVETIWGELPENGYLIVMSEGADTCRCGDSDPPSCITNGLANATRDLLAAGIKTYVVGYRFSDAPAMLNAIASNGGTDRTEFIPAGDEATLTSAFVAVVDELKGCD